MTCTYCGQEHPDNFKFCPETGQPIPQLIACTNSDCPNHGKHILPLDAKFCPRCGSPIDSEVKSSQIVVVCIKSGTSIQVGEVINKVTGERTRRLKLNKGENIISVNQYSDLQYGFSFTESDHPEGIKQILLDKYDTSNVTNMRKMFEGCSALMELDLSNFDTSNVTDMGFMFATCTSLRHLDLSSFNTLKVVDMGLMFAGCGSLASLNLTNFNFSNETDMYGMFEGCPLEIQKKMCNNWGILSNLKELFPLKRVVIRETLMRDLMKKEYFKPYFLRKKVKIFDTGRCVTSRDGITFFSDGLNNVINTILIDNFSGSLDSIWPKEWNKFGFSSKMSYDEVIKLFRTIKMSVIHRPHLREYDNGNVVFEAILSIFSEIDSIYIGISFSGDRYATPYTSNTMESIHISSKGRILAKDFGIPTTHAKIIKVWE